MQAQRLSYSTVTLRTPSNEVLAIYEIGDASSLSTINIPADAMLQTCFTSKTELQQAINDYINCNDEFRCKASLGYGYPIGNWCTGKITDMSYIFQYKNTFNEPLTNWDTAKVTSMR